MRGSAADWIASLKGSPVLVTDFRKLISLFSRSGARCNIKYQEAFEGAMNGTSDHGLGVS